MIYEGVGTDTKDKPERSRGKRRCQGKMKLANKYQLEICKAMLDRKNRVRGCMLNDNDYAVTFDGYRCFVFGKSQVVFDIGKIEPLDFQKLFERRKDLPLRITRDFYFTQDGHHAVKLEAENGEFHVWLRSEYLKGMDMYRLLGCSPTERVLVLDMLDNLIGAILPIDMHGKK